MQNCSIKILLCQLIK